MMKTLEEWQLHAVEKARPGDMVFDALRDWKEQIDELKEIQERLEMIVLSYLEEDLENTVANWE